MPLVTRHTAAARRKSLPSDLVEPSLIVNPEIATVPGPAAILIARHWKIAADRQLIGAWTGDGDRLIDCQLTGGQVIVPSR